MDLSKDLLIGQKVKWEIKNFLSRGLFLHYNEDGESAKVMMAEHNGRPARLEVDVRINLLQIDNS